MDKYDVIYKVETKRLDYGPKSQNLSFKSMLFEN